MHLRIFLDRGLGVLAQLGSTRITTRPDVVTLGPITLERDTLEVLRHVLSVAVEVAIALALLRLVPLLERLVIRWATKHDVPADPTASMIDRRQRVETLTRVTSHVAQTIIWVTTAIMVISHFGVNIGPLIAGAGVVGVAVGFGAQSIVKDFFSGFFILLENQFDVGDTVTIGTVTGTVERMTMRITLVRDTNGTAHFFANSNILNVANKTYGWGRAYVDVVFASTVTEVEARTVLEAAANRASAFSAIKATLLQPIDVEGPLEFTAGAVTWRLAAKAFATRTAEARRGMISSLAEELRTRGFAAEGSVLAVKAGRSSHPSDHPAH